MPTQSIAVKDRPILFSGPMVRAILDGRQTQTRRIVKPQSMFEGMDAIVRRYPNQNGCPYGAVGDRLWVRERTRIMEASDGHLMVGNFTDDAGSRRVRVRYEADMAESDWLAYPSRLEYIDVGRCVANGCYREAARLILEITEVRVERLQEISRADAVAEGIPATDGGTVGTIVPTPIGPIAMPGYDPLHIFEIVWDCLNDKKPGCAWNRNPFVWVINFKRIDQ